MGEAVELSWVVCRRRLEDAGTIEVVSARWQAFF